MGVKQFTDFIHLRVKYNDYKRKVSIHLNTLKIRGDYMDKYKMILLYLFEPENYRNQALEQMYID